MNSGKTLEILRTVHNYEENGFKVIIIKPSVDKKGDKTIVSRVGISHEVDFLIDSDELVSAYLKKPYPTAILADESQFFSRKQIDDLWMITKEKGITVFCYGLKSDFMTNAFPGSIRLFELADKIEEITTLCKCGNKAMFNLRMVNGFPVFKGNQVAIDGFDEVTYEPVCGSCYIKEFKSNEEKTIQRRRKKWQKNMFIVLKKEIRTWEIF